MPSDARLARPSARPARRLLRDLAHTDLEILDGLLEAAHAFRSAVCAAAPHLHLRATRAALASFEDAFDDLMGDTLRGARRAAEDVLDDASPVPPPGRAA
jgi:hypothetical protein